MTVATTGEPHSAVFPPGRYGRRRNPARRGRQRLVTGLAAALVVLAGVAIAVKLYVQYAQAPFQVRVISVTDLSDTQVTVTFEVSRPADQDAVCTVLGHTREGREVGRASVPVPANGETTTRVTYTLMTTQRPMTGEVPGCGPA